jgi:hypothetical protein
MKSVPNRISDLQGFFFGFFLNSYLFFPRWKAFRVYFYSENSWHVGLTCRSPSSHAGAHVSEPRLHLARRPCILLHVSSPSCHTCRYTARADSSSKNAAPSSPSPHPGKRAVTPRLSWLTAWSSLRIAFTSRPPENASLWSLSSLTAKPTLPSPSTVSKHPRSACSSCWSPHPPPFHVQDRWALIGEEITPRAARSRPRRRLPLTAPKHRSPSSSKQLLRWPSCVSSLPAVIVGQLLPSLVQCRRSAALERTRARARCLDIARFVGCMQCRPAKSWLHQVWLWTAQWSAVTVHKRADARVRPVWLKSYLIFWIYSNPCRFLNFVQAWIEVRKFWNKFSWIYLDLV